MRKEEIIICSSFLNSTLLINIPGIMCYLILFFLNCSHISKVLFRSETRGIFPFQKERNQRCFHVSFGAYNPVSFQVNIRSSSCHGHHSVCNLQTKNARKFIPWSSCIHIAQCLLFVKTIMLLRIYIILVVLYF